jgi:exodeoxyribonuclease V alpha subunit
MCGVYAINALIQEKMAKINGTESDTLAIGFNKYYRGDRVIQIENNYDKDVFNGDMGVITDLGEKVINASENDKKERFITVEYGGKKINYLGNEIDQLQLAWCCTVHKYQGSQSNNVVFVMSSQASIMMSKELIYTAFTRAAKQLHIFGHENMMRLAPTKSAISKRFTNMSKIIEELKGTHKVLDIIEKKCETN